MPTPAPEPLPPWMTGGRDHLVEREGLQLGPVFIAAWYGFSGRGVCYQLPTIFGPEADHFYFTIAEGIGASPPPAQAVPTAGPPVVPPFEVAVVLADDDAAVLGALAGGPLPRKTLAARLGRTLSGAFGRLVRRLAAVGWIERAGGDWQLSAAGRLALERRAG